MTLELVSINLDVGAPQPHHYPAMSAGADCARCPLRNLGRGPVPPTLPADIDVLVVAEAPGQTEIQTGQTLVGASGKEVRRALQDAGAVMDRIGYTNACMCAPPSMDMKKFLQQCKKRGDASPIDCCQPRLQRETARARFLLLMGGASLTAAGIKGSVMSIRGTPIIANGIPAIATPHAAFVIRDDGARYRHVFRADIAKAVRISRTGSTWRDPWYFVPKTAVEVANFLSIDRPRVAVDVETDGIDRWTCQLRRVGIGTDKEVLIYSPLSVRGHAMLDQDNAIAQARVIADYFQRAPRTDTHNGTAFDQVILNRYGMPLVDAKSLDGIIGHQIGLTSELPHRLDFLASMYTDAPSWKQDTKHSNVSSDEALDKYLSFDIATTFVSTSFVEQNLVWSGQQHVYGIDARLYQIGRSMSALGIYIDPVKRLEFAQEYQEKSDRLRGEFTEAAGHDVNPASVQQVRKLLYETLGLPILESHITDSDEPSTDENTLLDLLAMGVDARAEKVIHGLIGYREAEKILGTNTGHVVDGRLEGGPPVHLDGRIRTTWRPGKVTGRWGSSDPINLQNIGKKLRAMYVAAPNNVFVAADMQAVELRKVAELAHDEPLIAAFAAFDNKTGPDVHVANACGLFRCDPQAVIDEVRRFVKNFVYALTYAAEPPKIYQTLSLLRDDNLRPMFPHITLQEVERIYKLYWTLHPAIPAWRKKLTYLWRAQRFLSTQFHGRKRYFIGGESTTEFPAFMVSGSCADMQNDAIIGLVDAYPFDYANHRGLVVNGHDQLVVECAEREADHVKGLLRKVMEKQSGGVYYPAEPKVGRDWKSVS